VIGHGGVILEGEHISICPSAEAYMRPCGVCRPARRTYDSRLPLTSTTKVCGAELSGWRACSSTILVSKTSGPVLSDRRGNTARHVRYVAGTPIVAVRKRTVVPAG
jgi:hypothetical protein